MPEACITRFQSIALPTILLLAITSLLAAPTFAQIGLIAPAEKSYPQETSQPENKNSLEFKIVKESVAQSRNLLGQTASTIGFGLDSLFGSPDKNQPNESAITLRSGLKVGDSGELTQINTFNFQADLPTASSKLQLLIRVDDQNELLDQEKADSNDPDAQAPPETESTNTKDSSQQTPESFESRALQANTAGIFVRYIYKNPESPWQTTFDNGFQFATNSLELEPISYLRIGQTLQAGSWQIRPVPGIYWTESSGFGMGIALHTYKPIDSITSLQHTTGINYLFDDEMTYYQHGWQLAKTFSQDLRATYNITFYTNDEAENMIDEATISATLRRRIDGNWLFFSVTPADTLSAEDDYEGNMSITFQLEAKFGTQY